MADDYTRFRPAYDATTGRKLPHLVPEEHFTIFPNLRKTPKTKAAEKKVVSEPQTKAVKAAKKGTKNA